MNLIESIDLDRVVLDVFQTMLSQEVARVDEPWRREERHLAASVRFGGPVAGTVMIECSKPDACEIAHLLTGIAHAGVNEDVIDGLAEVANMIGGNLKSALHAGVGLSMPTVVESVEESPDLYAGRSVHRNAFACGPALVWVTYLSDR
jgi:chemotaxis protein CheX